MNAQIGLPGFCKQVRQFHLWVSSGALCHFKYWRPWSTLERRALQPLLITSFGDLIRSIMDLSNTTGKQKQSMTYWENCIIRLCTADNGIMQEWREKGRENKSTFENEEFYEECSEMDVAEAFSIVCWRMWFRGDYWSLLCKHRLTQLILSHNRAAQFYQSVTFLFPHLSHENLRRLMFHFIFQLRKSRQRDTKQLVLCHWVHVR